MPLRFRLGRLIGRLGREPDGDLADTLRRATTAAIDATDIWRAIRAAEQSEAESRPRGTLLLGQAYELLANRFRSWDERSPLLERALALYERAAVATTEGDKVGLEAAWHAGSLLAGLQHVRAPERALPHLARVITHAPGYHPAYYYLGEAYVLLKRFDEAEAAFRSGLALDPDQEGIRRVLHFLPLDRANDARAREDWAAVRAALIDAPITGESADALTLLGDALFEMGDADAAREAWNASLAVEPARRGMEKRFRRIDDERL